MKVLADFHHHDLYYSLQLLFEKRLGWELYRPIGIEWEHEGYWNYSHAGDTVKQYLGLDQAFKPGDGTPPLNLIEEANDGIYLIKDSVHNGFERAITLDRFSREKFDIVISSVTQHDFSFQELIKDRMPNAKHISQIGNIFQQNDAKVRNLMISTSEVQVPDGFNYVFYHQEFDLNVFKYGEPTDKKRITSFVNCLPNQFPKDFELYNALKGFLPEYEFRSYGGSCPDGSLGVDRHIASEMQNSMFGFHCKTDGDGYGHIIHNWFASGRPVITKMEDYKGKLAERLLVDGETCIDIGSHTMSEVCSMIYQWSDPYEHKKHCEAVYNKFKEQVNFDAEFEKIKEFLDNLI